MLPVFAATRLLRDERLRFRFHWLIVFLWYLPVRDLLLVSPLAASDESYSVFWGITAFPDALLLILVTASACKDLVYLYRESGRFWQFLANAGVATALIVASGSAALSTQDVQNLGIAWIADLFERWVAIAGFEVALFYLAVYWYFPPPLKRVPRNVPWSLGFVMLHCLGKLTELLLVDCWPPAVCYSIQLTSLVMYNVSYLGWLTLIREGGELSVRWRERISGPARSVLITELCLNIPDGGSIRPQENIFAEEGRGRKCIYPELGLQQAQRIKIGYEVGSASKNDERVPVGDLVGIE
jgi:hypothetical protein